MQVAVWDTYVTKKDGSVMHFDILAPSEINNPDTIYGFGLQYLQLKNQEGQPLSSKECAFCHIEKATHEMMLTIQKQGYYIVEMQGCN